MKCPYKNKQDAKQIKVKFKTKTREGEKMFASLDEAVASAELARNRGLVERVEVYLPDGSGYCAYEY